MAEKLFWAVFEHLGNLSPRFVSGKAGKRFARKFKRTIHLVDSTTIPLDRLVHGLGQASAAQSGRQMSSAFGPAKFSAALCHCGHRPAQRRQAGAGSVRWDQGR